MIIGIDAHYLGNKQSGNERYTRNLIHSLSTQYPGDTFKIYVTNPQVLDDLLFNQENIEPILLKPANPIYRISVGFPRELRNNPVDVLHVQYNAPLMSPAKLIVTMHDISWAKHPEWFPYIKGRQITLRAKHAIRNAEAIICGTKFVSNEIINWYSIDDSRLHVTPYGVDETKSISDSEVSSFKKKYDLPRPFVLCVGDLQPRKNVARLIEAFNIFLDSSNDDYELVLTGKQAWNFKDIFRVVKNVDLEKKVRFMGYLPQEDMPALYQSAFMFVYPSLYEGFGFPPLEAMSHDVPVAASNTGAVAEVVGAAGLSFDPLNTKDIAKSLESISKDERLRKNLVSAGRKRIKDFSWITTAKETMNLYRRVAEDKLIENKSIEVTNAKPT